MGSSQEEEGPPPNPIIIIITVITVALDQREVSPHRLQARDLRKNISSIGKEGRKVDLLSPSIFLAIPLNTTVTQKTEHVPSVPGRPSGTPQFKPFAPRSLPRFYLVLLVFSCAGSLLILRWLSFLPSDMPTHILRMPPSSEISFEKG